MNDDQIIALAAKCDLGSAMKPIGMQTGDVFYTHNGYRTYELLTFAREIEAAHGIDATPPAPTAGNEPAALAALDPNESDRGVLWAEIVRLQAAIQGPEGFATWQDAAVAERVRRVKAEAALSGAAQPERTRIESAPHGSAATTKGNTDDNESDSGRACRLAGEGDASERGQRWQADARAREHGATEHGSGLLRSFASGVAHQGDAEHLAAASASREAAAPAPALNNPWGWRKAAPSTVPQAPESKDAQP